MRYIKLSLIITMVFFAGPLLAQFQDKVIITVPWGEGSKELGRLQTGQSFWAPAFFALSSDGSVYIPDFYHQRILNFQRDGNYLGSIPIPDLNSRLRYFGFTGNFFVILDDRSVYTYDLLGQKIGSLNDVFLMPDFIYSNKTNIFITLNDKGRNMVIKLDKSLTQSSEVKTQTDYGNISVLQDDHGRYFTSYLKELKSLGLTKEIFSEDWFFLRSLVDGSSLWIRKVPGGDEYLWLNPEGRIFKRGSYNYPEGIASTGFWTQADDGFNIYKAQIQETGFKIHKLSWP